MARAIKAGSTHINLSAPGFRLWAQDYFKCYLDFQPPRQFSVVPYFLCCRAIELALKAKHLESTSQKTVKGDFGHNLMAAYMRLDPDQRALDCMERNLLAKAGELYGTKRFEYLFVIDAVTAYKHFPDLPALAALARKLTDYDRTSWS